MICSDGLNGEGKSEDGTLEHERRISDVLARAARGLPEPVEWRTPLDELMLAEEAQGWLSQEEAAMDLAMDFLRRWFDFVFAEGPHPGWVLRRLYALARVYRPDLMLRMNGSHLALLFGESRAAQSFRLRVLFDQLGIEQVPGVSKRRVASGVYAAAQRGKRRRGNKVRAQVPEGD